MQHIEQKNNKLIKKDQVADISIFKNISRYSSTFKSVLRRCTRKIYHPSTFIYEEGAAVDGVYLIEEGQVSLESHKHISQHTTQPIPTIHLGTPQPHNKSQRGQIIGQSDIKQLRRTFNARARTKTKLILIPNEIYHFLTQKISGQLNSENDIPLLHNLSPASIHQLYENSSKKKYNIRNIVYNIGQQSNWVYMIASGQFRVEGKLKNILYTLNNKSFFGFQDIFNDTNRVHKVVCTSAQGMLIQFRRQIFQTYCLSNPQVCADFKLVMEERIANIKKEIRKTRMSENVCYYPQNMLRQLNMNQQKKSILRSNKVFKTIDRQYKMVSTLKKFQKKQKENQTNRDKRMTPQPWFRSNDKKIMMRIRQMENKAGITSTGKDLKRTQSQHSVTRKFLKQLNYDVDRLDF